MNIYAQVGLVTLVGLIAKNGILIVEFANKLQEDGVAKLEAIRDTRDDPPAPGADDQRGCYRCRSLSLVLVTGAGAEARKLIGLVLVGGMATGTVFTLFVVPSIYILIAIKKRSKSVEAQVPAI